MPQSCQSKIQNCFSNIFGKWADIVTAYTTIIFAIFFVVFGGLSLGMMLSQAYEDEQLVWTPAENESIKNYEKAKELFDSDEKIRPISIIAESTGDNLLTIDAFQEMIDFENLLYGIEEFSDTTLDDDTKEAVRPEQGEKVTFRDICKMIPFGVPGTNEIVIKCFNTGSPISFIYELATDSYPLQKYNPNASEFEQNLFEKIKLGKTEPSAVLTVSNFLAATVPENVVQDEETGIIEDISKAKVASWSMFIENARNEDIDESFYEVWEEKLIDATKAFNESSQHVKISLFTQYGIRLAFSEDIQADLAVLQIAILLVATYTILVLGTLSGIHCRLIVSLMGLLCVGLSYASGFGLMFLLGGETAGVHGLMPFLLIGIGVDDMFVICNAVDQTDLKKPAKERIREAMQHAGPSITITSLTNALAFAFGGLNSLTALRSFCLFAAMSILMLYLIVMTVFLAVVVWDTERVGRKKGECCGACMCKQDSIFCCRGFFLSPKMIAYGTLHDDQADAKKTDERVEEIDPSLQASKTEKCLDKYLAPYILSTAGRIILLVIYVLLIAGAAYGCTKVEIDFKVTYFIGETAQVYDWFQLNDQYFSQGAKTTTYVDNATLDYSSEEVQKQMFLFNAKLEECEGCDEEWNLPNTLEMWYDRFRDFSYQGNSCDPTNTVKSVAIEDYIVPTATFYSDLSIFFISNCGKSFKKNIQYTGDIESGGFKITSWRQDIQVKKIDEISKQGVQYLKDLRAIEDSYALEGTYSYAQEFLDYELYFVFIDETVLSCSLSIVAVFFVVLFVTGSLPITFLVVLAVLLVDLFLIALIHYWDLTFNNVVVVNLVIAIGLAVDYSAHIAHTFLTIKAPKDLSNSEKRIFKARKAISGMGSSVFHGGFSTFLAIIALAGARSYIFVVFFRLWFGIIVFGMANGFLLLPIILSFIGPIGEPLEDESAGKKTNQVNKGDDLEMENKKPQSPDQQSNKVV